MNRSSGLITACLIAVFASGCDRQTATESRSASAPDALASGLPPGMSAYSVTGIVHRVEPDGLTAIIAHELIPGYMMAMTMPFEAKDPGAFTDVYPGDSITFRLLVSTNDAWVDRIQPTGLRTEIAPADLTAGELNVPEELDIGDMLPDCVLTNDQNQAFRLTDLRGSALALTFVFTRCPLPTYCPLMSRNFAAAGEILSSSDTLADWHLLTISFDPDFDSPKVLGSYARQYRTDPGHWTFATGDRITVEQLGRKLGLLLFRENSSISHNLRTVVVDSEGRIHHVFRNNQWEPDELAAQVRSAAGTASTTLEAASSSCELTLTGMACDACALTIQSALRKLPGITEASVDYSNRLATITYDPAHITAEAMIQRIESLTYGASLNEP